MTFRYFERATEAVNYIFTYLHFPGSLIVQGHQTDDTHMHTNINLQSVCNQLKTEITNETSQQK